MPVRAAARADFPPFVRTASSLVSVLPLSRAAVVATARRTASSASTLASVGAVSPVKYLPEVPVTTRLPAFFSIRTTYCPPSTAMPWCFCWNRTVSSEPLVSERTGVRSRFGSAIR